MNRQLLGIIFPLVIGLIVAGALRLLASDAAPLALELPWALIALLLGIITTSFAAAGATLARRSQRHADDALARQHGQFSDDRRRFIQRLDHELKNPLTAIRASITNLESETSPQGRAVALDAMTNQTARLVRLTTDLRKIADIESRPLESAEIDLTPLLTEVAELIRERADGARAIVLTLPQAPWPLPTIVGDWDLLFLACYNLADNALKYSERGDTIEIRAREESAEIIIEVADTGLGIAAEALPHVWDELYRAPTGHAIAGSGLGLPLVRAIIERHDGKITLTSRQQHGTNVTVMLPKHNA